MNSFKMDTFYTIILTQLLLTRIVLVHSKNITFKDVNICFYTINTIQNSIQENPNKYCKHVSELARLKNILPTADPTEPEPSHAFTPSPAFISSSSDDNSDIIPPTPTSFSSDEIIRTVHTISVRNQNIPVIYKNSFHHVNNVKVLVLQYSEVRVIEADAFLEATGFYKFDFQWNKIEELSAGIFNNLNLKYLNLHHNKIKHIAPDALDNLKYLLEINLSHNELSVFDNRWFKNTPVLQELHFENNSIGDVPATAFRNFRDHLSFSAYLSFNKIKQVDPTAFRDLQHTVIRKFYIDHNQLELWQEQLSSNIIELKIDHNKIKCFEGNLQQILKNCSVTHFEFNPYNCTCLKEIKTWSDENGEESEWFKSTYLKCREDAKKNGNRKRSGTLLHNLKVFSST